MVSGRKGENSYVVSVTAIAISGHLFHFTEILDPEPSGRQQTLVSFVTQTATNPSLCRTRQLVEIEANREGQAKADDRDCSITLHDRPRE